MYSNRYDRRLADVTTKAAIPEIGFLWESLTRVRCPALVCRGEESPILDDEIASRMVPRCRTGASSCSGRPATRCRAWPPERFAAMLRRFLLDEGLPAE